MNHSDMSIDHTSEILPHKDQAAFSTGASQAEGFVNAFGEMTE